MPPPPNTPSTTIPPAAASAAVSSPRVTPQRPAITPTDGELLALFARPADGPPGDESAFARLVDRHAAMVWRVCRKLLHRQQDAEDAFQATFLILARRATSIRTSESLAGWLYRVAYRTAMTAKRQSRKLREAPLDAEPIAPAEDPFPDLVGRQAAAVLMEELDRLPTKYQTPLVLRYLEGHSRRAIADQADTTIATVQGRLARGKKLLRSRLVRRGVSLSAAMAVVGVGAGAVEAAPVRVVSQTTAGAATLAAGGPVAAGAATLLLYRKGLRAMFLTSIGKPVATAAALGAVFAALAAPPALSESRQSEAKPGLTLSAEVADSAASEPPPANARLARSNGPPDAVVDAVERLPGTAARVAAADAGESIRAPESSNETAVPLRGSMRLAEAEELERADPTVTVQRSSTNGVNGEVLADVTRMVTPEEYKKTMGQALDAQRLGHAARAQAYKKKRDALIAELRSVAVKDEEFVRLARELSLVESQLKMEHAAVRQLDRKAQQLAGGARLTSSEIGEAHGAMNRAYGHSVERLQAALNERLEPSPDLAVDGDYGPLTAMAVARLQRERGVAATGFADAATRAALALDDPPVAAPIGPFEPPALEAGGVMELASRLHGLRNKLEIDLRKRVHETIWQQGQSDKSAAWLQYRLASLQADFAALSQALEAMGYDEGLPYSVVDPDPQSSLTTEANAATTPADTVVAARENPFADAEPARRDVRPVLSEPTPRRAHAPSPPPTPTAPASPSPTALDAPTPWPAPMTPPAPSPTGLDAPSGDRKQKLMAHRERLSRSLQALRAIEGRGPNAPRGFAGAYTPSDAEERLRTAITRVNEALGQLLLQEARIDDAIEATQSLLNDPEHGAEAAGAEDGRSETRRAGILPRAGRAAPRLATGTWAEYAAQQAMGRLPLKQAQWNCLDRATELNPNGWATIAGMGIGEHAPIKLAGDRRPRPHLRLDAVEEGVARFTIVDPEHPRDGEAFTSAEPAMVRDERVEATVYNFRDPYRRRLILFRPTSGPEAAPSGAESLPSMATARRLLYEKTPTRAEGPLPQSALVTTEAPRRIDLSDGKMSLGGSGHLVRFDLPEGVKKLKAIRIHGARYGTRQAPRDDFEIAFLSEDRTEILAVEHAAYGLFRRGDEKWTTVRFDSPIEVPDAFWIALDFNPGPTKGVYVSFDTSTDGQRSMTGLAQDEPSEHKAVDFGGDWMVQLLPDRE